MTPRIGLAAALILLPFSACECADPEGVAEGEGEGLEGEGEEGEGEGEGEERDAGFVGDSGVPVDCIDGLTALDVDPDGTSVVLDGVSTPDLVFSATGTVGGTDAALDPGALVWSVTRADDGDPGSIAAGVYAPNPALGGVVTVTATDGCVSGSTTVTFTVEAVLGAPVGDPADWQGAPTAGGDVPVIVYPSDRTRFPRNIYRTLFQWRAAGYTEFRLTFAGPGSTVTVYSGGVHALCAPPDAACFEADALAWSLIAGSNAGGTVTWTVDALDRSTPTPTVRRGESIELGFSLRDVRGAIFYWSTTSAGIRRANVGDELPEDYVIAKPEGTVYQAQGTIKCVACHTVSRDGRKIAAPVETTARLKSLWIMDVTLAAPPFPRAWDIADTEGHGWATFNPDTSRVMAAWGGDLWLVDGNDGSYVAPVDLAGGEGTQPDWSPAGTHVAYANKKGDAPASASIALLPVTGTDTFGTPEILVQQSGDRTNVYPMFSPEGRWLAFSRGKGGHGDDEMQLFVVDAQGPRPGAPVELVNASRVVSNELTDGQHQNAGPTWAPPGDLYWIAFNSKRSYGLVDEQGGTQQIWVAAVDPVALENGAIDPSYPAFRLQFQGLEEDNHRAFWALDVRDEPPPVDAGPPPPEDAGFAPDAGPQPDAGDPPACRANGEVCDPVDETCCDPTAQCASLDDGASYVCVAIGG